VNFDPVCLLPGLYPVTLIIADLNDLERYDWHERAYRLRVLSGQNMAHGLIYMPHTWRWSISARDGKSALGGGAS
jgi:hypothetical protein